MPARTAILIVNGFDRHDHWGAFNAEEALRYPWIDVSLRQVERHSRGADYEVHVYDNARLKSHRAAMRRHARVHVQPPATIVHLAGLAARVRPTVARRLERAHPHALDHLVRTLDEVVEYVVTLDSDAFPVHDGWLETLVGSLESGAAVAGIYRDEMADVIAPFVHVSCLCIRRRDFLDLGTSFGEGQDVGQEITRRLTEAGARIAKLRRSNVHDEHFLIGGVYGNLVYHHGAGSRHAKFWTSRDVDADEQARTGLRDAIFADLDGTIERLTGSPYGTAQPRLDDSR